MIPNDNTRSYTKVQPIEGSNQIPVSNNNSYSIAHPNSDRNVFSMRSPNVSQNNNMSIGQPMGLTISTLFMPQSEVLTGCETQNRYTVYACDVAGNKEGLPLFKCHERSGCCNRNCLPGDCREFKMEVTHESGGRLPFDGLPFLHMERPFKCTCFCLNRPVLEVNYNEGGQNIYVGRVICEFSCCEMIFSLFDKTNNFVYQIRGNLWQIGIYNRQQNNCAFCKSCQQAFLFIHDVKNGMKRVGIVEKRGRGFMELISDADNFSLLFPIYANGEERVLIMAACLLLDFSYFETKGGGNNNY